MNSTPTDPAPRDPFAMLLDPDRVVRDMEHSERLQRLQRRVCHPLDMPSMARGQRTAAAEFDRLIDESPVEPEEALDAREALDVQASDSALS